MEPPYADHRLFLRVRAWICALAGWCSLSILTLEACQDLAAAAEWSAAPSLSVKGVYNSNLLIADGNNEVFGYWITPAVKFRGATEALDVEAETRADFVHYFGDRDREFMNGFFPLRTSYRADRHTFAFEGGFTRDNTLRGELLTTGLVLEFTQRNMWTANPSWKVGITDRLSWQSGYHFADTTYQDGLQFGLVDYQVNGARTGPTYNLTELDQIQLTGEYTSVRIPFIGLHSTYYGAQGTWTHDFGDGLIGSLSGGARLVNSTQDVPAIPGIQGILLGRSTDRSVTSQEVVGLYRGSLRKQFERTLIQVDGSREINPSGFGLLLQTDRVGGSVTHNISETLSVALNGALYFVSGIATSGISRPLQQTTFSSISPAISWKFAQWWAMDVAYTYAGRAVDDPDQRFTSHSTFVMLTYLGEKWSVSR